MKYTVGGEEVNIAGRLEQLNKQYDTRILVGENTYDMAKYHFGFTQLGAFQLKGKQRSVRVYKVVGCSYRKTSLKSLVIRSLLLDFQQFKK